MHSARMSTRLVLLVTAMLSGPAFGQAPDTFPTRPISVVIPGSPGGASELWLRLFGQRISANSPGWNFVIDFKPGATGTLGLAYAAKAASDGYTLITLSSSLTSSPLVQKNLPYDPIKSFTPISLLSNSGSLYIVHASFPARTIKEYAAYGKANPGKINFGTSGIGSSPHLNGIWLHQLLGIEVTYVPYKSPGTMMAGVQSGEVHIASGGTFMRPLLKGGKGHALGVTTAGRIKSLPDVPTMVEQGATGFVYGAWTGIAGPAGLPSTIANRISAEFIKAGKHPEMLKKLAEADQDTGGSTPEEFASLITTETLRWRKLAAETNMKFEE